MAISDKSKVIKRSDKTSPLTQTEVDNNFQEVRNVIDDATNNESDITTLDSKVDTEVQRLDNRVDSLVYDSVAVMEADSTLDVGDKVRTLGYYAPGDGGGNDYEIVAAGTGTADGGSFIDLANGLQASLIGKRKLRSFGAKGDGTTDDTSAVSAFFAAGGGDAEEGVYLFSVFSIPDSARLDCKGDVVFRSDGTANTSGVINIGEDFIANKFKYSVANNQNGIIHIYVGIGSRIDYLETISDTQSVGVTVQTSGHDVNIGFYKSVNFDRPFEILNSDETKPLDINFILGGYDFTSYMRGMKISRARGVDIGSGTMKTRSPNALDETPGYNSMLFSSVQNMRVGDCYLASAGEHGIRIGGDTGTTSTTNVSFGNITIRGCSAAAVKLSPNEGQFIENVSFASIIGIDIGDESGINAKVSDGLRIVGSKRISIGEAVFMKDQLAFSTATGIKLEDVDGLYIGRLVARDVKTEVLQIAGIVTGGTGRGGAQNVYIGQTVCKKGANVSPISFEPYDSPVGNIFINGLFLETEQVLVNASNLNNITGPIIFSGDVYTTSGAFTNIGVPDSDSIMLDLNVNGLKLSGKAADIIYQAGADRSYFSGLLDPADNPVNHSCIFLQTTDGAGAQGEYTPGIVFSRTGTSLRRGSAIAGKQTGSISHNQGLAFLTGPDLASSQQLREMLLLKHTGVLQLPFTKQFATNTDAINGGLEAGDLYSTTSGELRIVV